jgi:nucleoside 2-deoxyribosyltransferase
MKIYLSHPHEHRGIGKHYQQAFTLLGHDVYNPFDADEEAIRISEAWRVIQTDELAEEMVIKDQSAILSSDMLIAILPPCKRQSVGTILEIAYAYHNDIPVIVFTDLWDHAWLMIYADAIVPLTEYSGLLQERI